MDSCIKNMYDAFKDDIWKELGPLDPNWFEVLTAQASLNERDVADNDELCANQEGHFKAPLEKTAAESQLFSTPKVFRHSRIVSPDTEDGPLFTAAQEKETLPWMPTQSPCLFQPPKQCVANLKCEGVQPQSEESFDLLDSPEKSSASYANHISESLGAQINPDISWTSSFNTPPALPSTLILSKTDESPCPVSVTADRKVVFVRKLFPSLSNSSLKTSRTSLGPVFPVTDTCFESPLNQSENHQQQKVPDALEGDVCSADAPKTFFANSSSALRKVKPDRVKRKQIIQTNVDVCSHENTSNSDNVASSEEAIADLESGGLPSTPLVKTGDTAISQWSPLSLSEISSSAVGSNMTLSGDTDSVQPTRPTLKITDSGFTQKKRKFVYTITTTKSPACGQDFQTTDPSLKISESEQQNGKSFMNTPDKEACQRTKNQRIIVEETIDSSLGTKLQDIDMSQLCRDFAQDFSQMTDLKPVENMQRNFSPAVCLSALKQAKQNRKPANFPNDYSCISKNRLIPTSNQPCSISEVTMIDSGFQSGVADVSHMTSSSFGLPLLENVGQNQPKLSFKTGMHNFPSTNGSGKPKFDVEVPVQRSGTGQALDHEKEIELHIASISTEELWDREEAVGESKSSQPQKTPVFLLPADASGFRTSSNKDIPISLANLEKAKCFFEVTEDKKSSLDNCTKSYHGIIYKSNSICEKATDTSSNSSLPACAGKSFGNVSSQLTASEKADVSELCTLLEEANSQFEFTQFKSTKKLPEHQHNHSLPQKEDKDLDPALLADLDFDDSFSSEGGKHSLVMMNNKVASVLENRTHGETAKAINQCTGVSDLLERETPLNSLSGNISEEREFLKFDKPNILPGAEDTEARYLENNKGVIDSEAFRTAGGNVLHVSKKCLNKAKALFADLESNLTDQKPSDKQNGKNAAITEQKCNRDSDTSRKDSERKKENWDVGSKIENCFSKLEGVVCSNKNVRNKSDAKSVKNNEIDTIICENGFRKASGKGISISANYMQEADAFFKDCHVMEHKESKKSFSNYKSPQVSISKKSVTGCSKLENVNTAVVSHHTKGRRLNEVERNGKFTAALKNEDEKSFPTSKPFAMLHPSKSTDSSAFEELCTGDGFCTAAGKNISVSAVAMKKDESLLNHIHAPEEINKETNEKEKALKTKCLGDKISNLDAGGFQVVNGKKCAISSTPLKKATLLKESEKSQDEICISSHQSSSKIPVIPVTNLWSCGFSTASGKPVVLSSVALEKTQTLFSDISLNMDKVAESAPVKQDKKHQTEPEKICSGFTTAGGANDQMSQEKFYDLVLAKAVEDEDALSTNGVLESNNVMLGSVGSKKEDEKPHTDQRFRTHTPVEAVKGCFKDADKQEKHKENLVPQASCGFKTASGKKVEISFEALKKAENLLGDCVGVMDTVNAALPESKAIDLPVRNDGFQSASGKPVALSSEALQKAKSLFSDIGFRAEDSDTSQIRSNNQNGSNNTEKMSCGFTTARGEKVDVLQKNLQKAKVLFKELDDQVLTKAAQEENAFFAGCDMDINKEMLENDLKGKVHMQRSRKASVAKCYTDDEMRVSISIPQCSSNANKQVEQRENILPQASCGFQTASGKRVDVSSEALKKAGTLFNEFEGIQDKTNAMSSQSKPSALSLRSCGFHSASGKPMTLSTEAVQKAKSLFGDITSSTEDSDFSQIVKAHGEQDCRSKTQKTCCGFTTAKGEKVDVLQKNLQRAKFLFKEVDDLALTKAMQDADHFFNQEEGWTMDNNSEKSSEQINTAPVNERGSIKGNMSKLRTNTGSICEEPESGSIKAKQSEGGFQTASGKRVDVSSEALKKAGTLFNEFEGIQDKTNAMSSQSKSSALSLRNCGFHSASGKPMALSTEAVQKAKSLFGDITSSTEDSDFSQIVKAHGEQDSRSKTQKICCGFTTAKGEKVDVSQKNLQRAKFLFKEVDDLALTKAMQDADHFFNQEEGWTMDSNSEKSLEQINTAPVNERVSIKGNMSKPRTNTGSICEEPESGSIKAKQSEGGFQTASGKTVAVSAEALSRSKHLLSENKADEESTCVFAASGKPFLHEALQKAKTFFRSGVKSLPSAADSRSDDHVDEKSHLSICNLNTKSSNQRSDLIQTNKSSDPKFQLLNLAGCTETQHKFLAQEALDCTKALLEDEVLAGQSLLTTSENLQLLDDQDLNKKSAEEDKGRKRRSAEDLTAQPPSKRRLLEEFDRTAENSRGSGLHPVKSGPNGLMDRGVFRYGAFLHPNITKPNRDAKSFVDTRVQRTIQMPHSDQGDCRSAACRMPTFVPPFFKNAKRDPLNKPEARDRKKVPAFVPPFKKQRVVQQESSPKQQEDNKQHHSLRLGTNSKTDAPLTKTTQSCEEVVTLVNSSNTKMISQNVPLKVESVSSTEMLHVDDKLSESQDRTENIGLARDMQDMRIRKKKRQTIRPLPGSLFLTKTSGVARIPLKAAVSGNIPARYSPQELYECGVHKYVPEITGANAESFRFNLLQFVKQETLADGGGVQLADGGWLIPSDDWTAGKEEFYRALCDTSGVDPKLISEQWVYNHYRWIVWKQASMEKSFPETMGSLCLTPEQVLLQLKYRYDVEVDHSRRPALRKIMERDDTPAKTLVLCVCEIISKGHLLHAQSCSDTKMSQSAETKVETPVAVVRLTDGWYAIKAQLDEPLTAMLHKGRLAVGGKLIIHGAQLIGPQDGCSPLEAPDSLMLKICANSTRRARWDAKLGFHTDPRPFLLPVSCLYSNGGPVGCVDIFILRSYPMQWMERKSDGGVVFRSVRAEEKEARRFNSHKQKAVELLFAKVQAEFEKEEEGSIKCQRRRQTVGKQDIGNLQEGEDLYEALGDDPAYLEAHLSEQQLESLQAYRRSLMEKKQAELQDRYWRALDAEDNEMSCPKRDVTPVWRLCIADSRIQSSCVYQLNLWRPSSDLQSLLKEGRRFKVYNLVASDGKKRSSVETVQLTGTKKTQFQELQVSQEWVSSHFRQRISTDFVDLQNEEFKPLCGEVDLTGLVISVVDQQGSSPAFYLVDGKKNFVKVRCFSSLTQAGLEDIVKPRVLLALSNLQLRGQSIHPTPVLYAGDLTAFSTNPKEIHLQESLNQLKNVVQGQDNFFLTAEEKLAHLIKPDGSCSSSLQPQTPVAARRQDSKTNMAFLKPIKSLGSFTPVSSNLPVATSSTEKDPKSLKRKRALDYLSRIPSPPPISPLGSVVSPCVNKTFNPPRRSGAPSTLKPVQTATPKPTDSLVDDEWVNDEELVMIDTQALHVGNLF